MCTGDVQQGNSPAKDLVGKSVFTFGTQKKGDFYVPADRIKVHSQLTVHPSGRITIGFCNAQVTPSSSRFGLHIMLSNDCLYHE